MSNTCLFFMCQPSPIRPHLRATHSKNKKQRNISFLTDIYLRFKWETFIPIWEGRSLEIFSFHIHLYFLSYWNAVVIQSGLNPSLFPSVPDVLMTFASFEVSSQWLPTYSLLSDYLLNIIYLSISLSYIRVHIHFLALSLLLTWSASTIFALMTLY